MTGLEQFDSVYNILILVTFVTLITWRLKIPSTIALIIAGILASISTRLIIPDIGSEIFITLLLPPILFQEALHLNVDDLISEINSIILFATAGTIVIQLLVGAVSYFVLGFDVLESLLFGILIAPTDPVAVIRQFHTSKVDHRFQIIVSGESLFNDGVSIVIYSLILTILSRGSMEPLEGILVAIRIIFGGILLGIFVGYIVHSLYVWTEDTYVHVLTSFIVAFGVYRLAEEIGLSGVLALVVAGLIINYRSRKYGGLGRVSYEMLENLWEFIGFLSSSIAFIFIGLNLDRGVFSVNFSTSLVVFLLLLLFRKIMVELVSIVVDKMWLKDIPGTWRNGFTWAGLRGAVSIVLALGIRGLVPNSEYIIAITFGVVILSNFVQGTTMGTLINDWKLRSLDHSIEGWDNIFSNDYVDSGYSSEKSLFERLFFSAPEFFIRDTRFGTWLAGVVVSIVSYINSYEVDSIQRKTIGIVNKLLKSVRDVLIDFLAWINEHILKWDETK